MVSSNLLAVRNCRYHLQATRVYGIFPFISPHWYWVFLHLTSFIKRILSISLVSTRIGKTLNSFWECLSSFGVITRAIRLLRLKTQVQQELVKNLISITPPGVVQTQGIRVDQQSHLLRRLAEEFRVPLRGLTCAISVSVQHHPPCNPRLKKINKYMHSKSQFVN